MKHYRYGKFQISDYIGSWCIVILYWILAFGCIIAELPFGYTCVPIIFSIIRIYSIIRPYKEQFEIKEDIIVVKNGKKETKKTLHKEMVLIISYVDTCPLFVKRTAIGNETHILKDRYAVSIIQKMPLEDIIERLHRNYVKKYTTSTIKDFFEEYNYIYSFVTDEKMLEELLFNRKCVLVIPKSLVDKVEIKATEVEVYIDVLC